MNDQPNPADFALAMYATACESHQRRDWREACHALAKALKAEQLASASRATMATAAPMPEPVTPAPRAKAAKRAKAAAGPESFNMTAGSLARAMRLVCRAVEKRNHIPILDNALIEARGDVLVISGTDRDRAMTVTVEAPGIGEWKTTAGAHDLLAILAKADKAAPVQIVGDAVDPRLHVTIGRAVKSLPTLPAGDWPVMLDGAVWIALNLDGPALISALAFATPAMSTEETRFYLMGAYLHTVAQNGVQVVRVAGCDGHRLHLAGFEPKAGAGDIPGMIIPRKAVADILAGMGDGVGASFATCGAAGVQMTRGPVTITSKLIDGSFPDYQRIIPNDSRFTVRADREELAATVAGAASVSKEKSRSVRFTMQSEILALECKNMEGGKAVGTLAADYTETPAKGEGPAASREWGMNAAYVKDALASLDGDTVTMAGACPASPFLVTGANPSRLVVLMPLRV